jgi:hypothetical protein
MCSVQWEAMEAHGQVDQRESEVARLEAEMAEVCGGAQRRHRPLVGLIARVAATEAWQGWGIRSAEHWVAWKCGVSARRAGSLVAMPDAPTSCPRPAPPSRLLHLGADAQGRVAAQLHGGPVLAPGLRRYLSCDARVRGSSSEAPRR